MTDKSWRGAAGRFVRSVSRALESPALSWSLIGLGVLLRLRQYLSGRSLWLDETLLALNVIERPFARLFEPLTHNQHAPAGFLCLQHLAVQALGSSEYALRFFPLVAGLSSLFLFRVIARRCLAPEALPIALGLFAVSAPLVNYSSEAKQYSSDLAVALLILAAALRLRSVPLTAGRIVLFAGLGAASIWFSHPAAFVLAGVGVVLGTSALRSRDRARVRRLLWIAFVWGASFAISYFLFLRHSLANSDLVSYWDGAFLPPTPLAAARWLADRFLSLFRNPAGLPLAGIGALAFAMGCAARLALPGALALLLSPALLTIAASALRAYPFEARFLFFLVPAILIVVARGADAIKVATRREAPLLGALVLALLLLPPLGLAARNFLRPMTHHEVRPALAYVRSHWKPGDLLYGYRSSAAFRYYLPRLGFAQGDFLGGVATKGDWRAFASDLDRLRGRGRVWVVFPGLPQDRINPDVPFFLYCLDGLGTRLDSFEAPGAAAYLYQLGKP